MKRFSEQLHKKSTTVKLRALEKRELRERVVSYMEYHPLPQEMRKQKAVKAPVLTTEEFKEIAIPFKMLARWAVGVAAIVIIAVPFAAERSVPGDSLYAVKRFNEDVRSTLAFNTIQKVEWETTLLNRRIAEARLLESEGRLTDEAEAAVVAAVRTHSDNAQKNIEVLRGEDEDEATLASIAFETTLSVQSAALNDDTVDEVTGEVVANERPSLLAAVVKETRDKTTATNASSTIPAFDKVMAKVELNTTRVFELRDSLAVTATDEQIAEINRRIEDIERSVAEAIGLRDEDDESARSVLIDSLQRTQKLVVFMTDIEVSQTVDIEEIVPVVLTREEEAANLADLQTELEQKLVSIQVSLEELEDTNIREKVQQALVEIETLEAALATQEEYIDQKQTLESAIEFADDMLMLLEFDDSLIEVPVEVGTSTDLVATSTDEVVESDNEVETEGDEDLTEETPEEIEPEEETATTTEEVSTTDVDTE